VSVKIKTPTREEFDELCRTSPERAPDIFVSMSAAQALLEERVTRLEGQLKQDSHNSHKPPSSDGFKRVTKSTRPPSKRSSGGGMSYLSLFQTKHLVLGLVLLFIVSAGGCPSSKQTTYSEDLSEPLDFINRTAEPKSPRVADAQNLAPWEQVVDSLLSRHGELEQHLGELTERLQLVETTLKTNNAYVLKVAMNQLDRSSRPDVGRAPDRYEEVIRQYKAASDRFQQLLKNGVPQDVQDQVHYAVGIAKRVDSLQIIVAHNAQLYRQDLDSKVMWIYLLTGVMVIMGMMTYGAFNQVRKQRNDLERRVFGSLSSSFSFFDEKLRSGAVRESIKRTPKTLNLHYS
jgi:transposase